MCIIHSDDLNSKVCTRCGERKDVSQYHKNAKKNGSLFAQSTNTDVYAVDSKSHSKQIMLFPLQAVGIIPLIISNRCAGIATQARARKPLIIGID